LAPNVPLSPVLDDRAVQKRKKPVHEGPAQTMASPRAVAVFRVQALERKLEFRESSTPASEEL